MVKGPWYFVGELVGCGGYSNHYLLRNGVGNGIGGAGFGFRGLVTLQVMQSVLNPGERVVGIDGRGSHLWAWGGGGGEGSQTDADRIRCRLPWGTNKCPTEWWALRKARCCVLLR